jgi:hypothetical protein
MTSLEGWGSTIELRPRRSSQQRWSTHASAGPVRVAYRLRWPGTSSDSDREDLQGWAPGGYPELTSGNTTRVTVLPACNATGAS